MLLIGWNSVVLCCEMSDYQSDANAYSRLWDGTLCRSTVNHTLTQIALVSDKNTRCIYGWSSKLSSLYRFSNQNIVRSFFLFTHTTCPTKHVPLFSITLSYVCVWRITSCGPSPYVNFWLPLVYAGLIPVSCATKFRHVDARRTFSAIRPTGGRTHTTSATVGCLHTHHFK